MSISGIQYLEMVADVGRLQPESGARGVCNPADVGRLQPVPALAYAPAVPVYAPAPVPVSVVAATTLTTLVTSVAWFPAKSDIL